MAFASEPASHTLHTPSLVWPEGEEAHHPHAMAKRRLIGKQEPPECYKRQRAASDLEQIVKSLNTQFSGRLQDQKGQNQ